MESLSNTISSRRNPRKDFTYQCFRMKLLWMYSLSNFAICSMPFHVQHVYLHSIWNTKVLKCTFGITAIARHHSPGFTCQTKRLLHKSPSSLKDITNHFMDAHLLHFKFPSCQRSASLCSSFSFLQSLPVFGLKEGFCPSFHPKALGPRCRILGGPRESESGI